MPVSDDLQLEPASYLLLVLLHKGDSHSPDDRASMAKYVESHKSEIEATCRVLEWLRLAAPAKAKSSWLEAQQFTSRLDGQATQALG
jgi:hypothetical protein